MDQKQDIIAIIAMILEALGHDRLIEQLNDIVDIHAAEPETPMIRDIELSSEVNRLPAHGLSTVEVGALYSFDGYKGEIIVFFQDGLLAWVEAPYYSEKQPPRWPHPEEVQVYQKT